MSKWLELARTLVCTPDDLDNSVDSVNRWADRDRAGGFVANVAIDAVVGANNYAAPPAVGRDTAAFLIGATHAQRREWWRRTYHLPGRDRNNAT